jgi:hypothetical protein
MLQRKAIIAAVLQRIDDKCSLVKTVLPTPVLPQDVTENLLPVVAVLGYTQQTKTRPTEPAIYVLELMVAAIISGVSPKDVVNNTSDLVDQVHAAFEASSGEATTDDSPFTNLGIPGVTEARVSGNVVVALDVLGDWGGRACATLPIQVTAIQTA